MSPSLQGWRSPRNPCRRARPLRSWQRLVTPAGRARAPTTTFPPTSAPLGHASGGEQKQKGSGKSAGACGEPALRDLESVVCTRGAGIPSERVARVESLARTSRRYVTRVVPKRRVDRRTRGSGLSATLRGRSRRTPGRRSTSATHETRKRPASATIRTIAVSIVAWSSSENARSSSSWPRRDAERQMEARAHSERGATRARASRAQSIASASVIRRPSSATRANAGSVIAARSAGG
jgi:hypothetical protein